MLAILSDFDGVSPEIIIKKIIIRLQQLTDKKLRLTKYEKQLEILSKLRKLQKQTIQTITQMGWEYELETDIRYLQGKEVENRESKTLFVTNLLTQTDFDNAKIALLVGVPIDFIEKIKKSLIK